MKYFATVIILLVTSFASAQIVNIPDPNFKAFLTTSGNSIDINQDGEIQLSEALAVTNMDIIGTGTENITDLTGIRSFANLEILDLMGPQPVALDLSDMPNLNRVSCSFNNSLSSLNISGCNNLSILDCKNTSLTHLDLQEFPNLASIDCSTMPNLIELIADGAPRLKSANLTSAGNSGSYFSFKNCDSLNNFNCFGLNAQTLDISGSKQLTQVFNATNLGNLVARNCTGLTNIDEAGLIDNIDVTGCINLTNLFFNSAIMQYCDLSSCISLNYIDIGGGPIGSQTFNVNIKNGSSASNVTFHLSRPVNICADDFEIDALTQLFGTWITNVASISSYCSFFPGGSYNTIKGKVKLDLNNNGCDNADAGISAVPIRITDANGGMTTRYSAGTGNFAHYPYAGNFTLTPYFPYPYFTLTPSTANINFDTANSLIDSVAFCISPNGVHNDLQITLLPGGNARPGFLAGYHIIYKNSGTSTQSGSVQLDYDNSKMSFYASSPVSNNQTAGQLTWNYSNLLPFESRDIYMTFDLLPPPTNNIGDTLIFLSAINSLATDETPGNNSFILPQGLRGSYDPNDKICLQGEKLTINNIGKPLDYIIHFQNLGNDTAFNVVVADQLSDKYDWNTVEITGSSHPFELREKDGKLEFIFENIKLPYAAINEPASHGFVAFKVKPKSTLLIGDSLNNRASIYFDFNLPVVTNIASTIVIPTSTVPVKLEYFSLVNKNEGNQLIWKASSTTGITDFAIEKSNDGIHFNNIGNITATMERCQSPFNFTDAKPFDGKTFYRINIKDANGISFYSKVLVAERTRSGLSIVTAIVSDNNTTTLYLNASQQQTVQMKIIAADGRLVFNQTKTIEAGSSTMNLPLRILSTGIYTLVVYTNDGEVITKRFIK